MQSFIGKIIRFLAVRRNYRLKRNIVRKKNEMQRLIWLKKEIKTGHPFSHRNYGNV